MVDDELAPHQKQRKSVRVQTLTCCRAPTRCTKWRCAHLGGARRRGAQAPRSRALERVGLGVAWITAPTSCRGAAPARSRSASALVNESQNTARRRADREPRLPRRETRSCDSSRVPREARPIGWSARTRHCGACAPPDSHARGKIESDRGWRTVAVNTTSRQPGCALGWPLQEGGLRADVRSRGSGTADGRGWPLRSGATSRILTVDVKSKAWARFHSGCHVRRATNVKSGTRSLPSIRASAQQTWPRAANLVDGGRAQSPAKGKRPLRHVVQSASDHETEYETAKLGYGNANAAVVRPDRTSKNARERMTDTRIRAPLSGTIIAKNVELGTVISSPTTEVGGGPFSSSEPRTPSGAHQGGRDDIGKVKPVCRPRSRWTHIPTQPFEGSVLKSERSVGAAT